MKTICVCVVRLAIDAKNKAEASDGVSALLSEQANCVVPNSCLLDWQYDEYGSPKPVLVDDDFGFDSGVSQLPGRTVYV